MTRAEVYRFGLKLMNHPELIPILVDVMAGHRCTQRSEPSHTPTYTGIGDVARIFGKSTQWVRSHIADLFPYAERADNGRWVFDKEKIQHTYRRYYEHNGKTKGRMACV